jgi:hypothetical protein
LKTLSILAVAVIVTSTLAGNVRMTVSTGYSNPSIISSNVYYDNAIIPLRIQITAEAFKGIIAGIEGSSSLPFLLQKSTRMYYIPDEPWVEQPGWHYTSSEIRYSISTLGLFIGFEKEMFGLFPFARLGAGICFDGYRDISRSTWENEESVYSVEWVHSSGGWNIGCGMRLPIARNLSFQADWVIWFPNTTGNSASAFDKVWSLNLGVVIE